jgi:TonB family protein
MASPAKIMHTLPETLPEDFSEWDSGHPAATLSVNASGFEPATGHGAATKRPTQSESPSYGVLYALDGSTDIPMFTARSFYAGDEGLLRSFRSNAANKIDPKRTSKKIMKFAVVTVGSILLLLGLIPRLYPSLRPRLVVAEQSNTKLSTVTDKDPATNTRKRSPSKLRTGAAQSSSNGIEPLPSTLPATASEPTRDGTEEVTPPQVESKMMTDQLTAPKQIPHDIKIVAQTEAPPSSTFGGADLEGLGSNGGNVIASVFGSGNNGPKVKAEALTKINISSGVAAGMLVHKTTPQYPGIAKLAHVSGTVVVQATVSKAGTIANLHVITGPDMLRQAALDAVKSWRYRPYLLNGEPVEVETTVSVVFTQSGQ